MAITGGYSSVWEDDNLERRGERAKGHVISVAVAGCAGAAVSSLIINLPGSSVSFLRFLDPPLRPLVLCIPPLFAAHRTLYNLYGKRSRFLFCNTAFGIGVAASSASTILKLAGSSIFAMKSDGDLPFGLFVGSLCFYHLAEYLLVAYYNPTMLSIDSFLVNQTSYVGAMSFAICEYFVSKALVPAIKGWGPATWLGFAGVVFGEFFRKGALIQAGSNFTHQIADGEKRHSHRLVQHGVYSVSRHPGYFGWFWWSTSSQVMLANPISTILFSSVAWRFFNDRIPYEESHLQRFFPEYREYKRRVPTRIPYIP